MDINGKTKFAAILGNPVGHSLSPVMHNTFFQLLKMNYAYIPFEIDAEKLDKGVEGLWNLGFIGANITIPFKEKIIKYLVGISPEARLIGAVNTLVRKDNGFWGENTDGKGFLRALKQEKEFTPQGKRVVVLGAGGSARAVCITLALDGAEKITIVNRSLAKGKEIGRVIEKEIGVGAKIAGWEDKGLKTLIQEGELIVNTTPLGMKPNVMGLPPLNTQWLTKDQLVVDIIYSPLETRFLKEAAQQGCQTQNGLGMLINQGLLAFEKWTGVIPPAEEIRKILQKQLALEESNNRC
ncbi:MAG: shikimate dehydrogenase [Bacillota bacterium]